MKNFKDVPQNVKEQVRRMIGKNRFPHCILLTGGTEDQRTASAIYIAAALQCGDTNRPCENCRSCIKIKNGVHPDVDLIGTGGKSETVRLEDLKQIKETCYILPNEGAARVYMIPQGGKIRTEGQNSLLKIIEEPPEYVYVIICSEVRSVLLPTVLSRSYEIAVGSGAESKESARSTAKINDICRNVCKALAEKNEFALVTAFAPAEKDRNTIAACASRLMLILRDALTAEGSLSGLPEAAELLRQNLAAKDLLKMADIAESICASADRNANVNLMISLFASKLFDAIAF